MEFPDWLMHLEITIINNFKLNKYYLKKRIILLKTAQKNCTTEKVLKCPVLVHQRITTSFNFPACFLDTRESFFIPKLSIDLHRDLVFRKLGHYSAPPVRLTSPSSVCSS